MQTSELYEELNLEAERQGLVVELEVEGRREESRLRRVLVADPRAPESAREVVAMRLGAKRTLEEGSLACLRYLRRRRERAEA